MEREPLLELHCVGKTFRSGDGGASPVLEGIDLCVNPGEIIVLFGRSGCGKSTLLRIIAGLTPATMGEVRYKGQRVTRPQPGISMVFQTFALFPWLNVQQNVELGLEAAGVPAEERRRRALEVIDMIGLDGFESAYPKELSGGMRQRVGFARALVVHPDVLLMDEPFSALDVPTTEALRHDLMDLWTTRQIPTRAMLLVSHNIEESALVADRIVILHNNPGSIKSEIRVQLKHPRDPDLPAFRLLVDQVYAAISSTGAAQRRKLGVGYRLPSATVGQMMGLLERLNLPGNAGGLGLSVLAEVMQMEVDELFPIIEALELMVFTRTGGQRVELTPAGKTFAEADILQRKIIFGEQLLQRIPLATNIRHVLEERSGSRAPRSRFLRELEDHLSEEEAERVLGVVTDWGRYAEVLAYDGDTGTFSLENPGSEHLAETP